MPDMPGANRGEQMKILVTGSSGLIGTALLTALGAAGHHAVPLIRRSNAPPGAVFWDPMTDRMDSAQLADIDAVVHLAGESLAHGRWTAAKKLAIANSRIQPTSLLARTLAQLQPRPRVLLCASAIGYYGDRDEEILAEDSPPGQGYLADLCQQWEQASAPAAAAGIRVVHMRLGVVLSATGGALAQMLTPFRLGLGGNIGNGRQYVSWVALEDVIAAVLHLLDRSQLAGPVNLVAPQSVTNRQLTKALGRALHRPTLFPLPAFGARILLGEMADELLLASTRVVPRRLQNDGFPFGYPDLDGALSHLLK
jgi:uncharacterized protein (TIGR01777 family)